MSVLKPCFDETLRHSLMCSLCLYVFLKQMQHTWKDMYTFQTSSTYHSAATLHVMEVSVSVGAEVQTSSDPREGAAVLEPQTTIWCPVFMFHLCQGTKGGTLNTILRVSDGQ